MQGSDLPAQGRVQAGALLGGGRGQRAGAGGGEPAEEGGAARAQPPLPPAAQAVHQVWYSKRLLYPQNFLDNFMGQRSFISITPTRAVQCPVQCSVVQPDAGEIF